MSTKVSKFMGGLGIDATDKFEVQSNATVTLGDGEATGNLIVGGQTNMGGFTANGVALFGNTASGANRVRIVTYPPNNSVFNQIGDGTFNTGGSYHFSRFLSADNIAVTMNTITYSMEVTGNLSVGTNESNTVAVTGDITTTRDLIVSNTIHITKDIFVSGDVSIGSHSDNTFTVTGIFDCGALS